MVAQILFLGLQSNCIFNVLSSVIISLDFFIGNWSQIQSFNRVFVDFERFRTVLDRLSVVCLLVADDTKVLKDGFCEIFYLALLAIYSFEISDSLLIAAGCSGIVSGFEQFVAVVFEALCDFKKFLIGCQPFCWLSISYLQQLNGKTEGCIWGY